MPRNFTPERVIALSSRKVVRNSPNVVKREELSTNDVSISTELIAYLNLKWTESGTVSLLAFELIPIVANHTDITAKKNLQLILTIVNFKVFGV